MGVGGPGFLFIIYFSLNIASVAKQSQKAVDSALQLIFSGFLL